MLVVFLIMIHGHFYSDFGFYPCCLFTDLSHMNEHFMHFNKGMKVVIKSNSVGSLILFVLEQLIDTKSF